MTRGVLENGAINPAQKVAIAATPAPALFRDSTTAPAANDHLDSQVRYTPVENSHQETHRQLCPSSLAQLRLRSYIALLLIDIVSIAAAFVAANFLRFGQPFATAGLQCIVDLEPVFLALTFTGGAYAVEVLQHPRTGVIRVLRALALAAFALLLGLFYTKTSIVVSRAVFGLGVVLGGAFAVSARYLFGLSQGKRHGWNFLNEVVLVDGTAVIPPPSGTVLYAESAGLTPYGNDPDIADRVGQLLKGSDRIVLACSAERRRLWLKMLKGVGVDVEVLTPELEHLGALGFRNTANGPAVLIAAGPLGLRDRIVKRTLDLIVAVSLLVVLAPLLLVTAAAIKLTSDGPVFFHQRRIGRGNHPFEVLKFRTMRIDACDSRGTTSASRTDRRVTRVGAVLRQTSIDELPQLLNVLRGDMSIVGPRPHALGSTAEDDVFWKIDDRYWQRGAVKPGITGLAQVRGLRGATGTRRDLTDRIQADLEYLANWSVWKDVGIILRTARVLVHPNAF
jgi:lipopolysaccharide/colanic/teichoic acid biosynthesis glycosyltransferase